MMLSSVILFGQCAAQNCTKCPNHAIFALAGALVVGLVIGFLLGRRGAKKQPAKRPLAKKGNASAPRREPRADNTPTREPIPAGSVEIYVGNLSYDLTEQQLREMFEKFGTVSSVRIVTNKYNDKSKGFGFVVMPNRPEAEAAIAATSEQEFMGRKMRVNEAKNTLKEEE